MAKFSPLPLSDEIYSEMEQPHIRANWMELPIDLRKETYENVIEQYIKRFIKHI